MLCFSLFFEKNLHSISLNVAKLCQAIPSLLNLGYHSRKRGISMDENYMKMALQLATSGQGQTSPNPLVGAVVVKDDRIIGMGAHLRAGTPHAEVHALRMAGSEAAGATLYVTLEPCNHQGRTPPCTEAILAAGIARVVVAALDVNPQMSGQSIQMLKAAGIEVRTGVLESESVQLNVSFAHFILTGRPYVVWKWASTLDGKIAANRGNAAEAVTGAVAHADVQELRRSLPAIGIGIGTLLADNPRLTIRNERHTDRGNTEVVDAGHQPLRVIFDSQLRTPDTARLLAEPGATCILTTQSAYQAHAAKVDRLQSMEGVKVVGIPEDAASGHLDLHGALRVIGSLGCSGLLLEGGSRLGSAFLAAALVNQVVCYLAPTLLCGGVPATEGRPVVSMTDAIRLRDLSVRTCGDDLRITGFPEYV
jgi:diaminohydroxyphosphoribosylaminopyrimidine deaminase / 5-amino-6-(5-phosphoribosylamino)uracil reductase